MEADTKKYCCFSRSSLPYSVASLGYLPHPRGQTDQTRMQRRRHLPGFMSRKLLGAFAAEKSLKAPHCIGDISVRASALQQ